MKLLFLLLLVGIGFCGCDKPASERYFYVYYQANSLDGSQNSPGDIWFPWSGFPAKHELDSLIYDGLGKKKECYQPILVSYFFEFKSKEDFDVFGKDYKGNITPTKEKGECCNLCPTDSVLIYNSTGTIITLVHDSSSIKQKK